MNLSAYQRNVLRQVGTFMGAFDREPQWHDPDVEAEHPVMAEQRKQAAAEQQALEREQESARALMIVRRVESALDDGDENWRWNIREHAPGDVHVQTIRWLFEARDNYRRDLENERKDRMHYANEYLNVKAQLDRTLGRRFKRLFESIKAWERERWDKRWK